MASSNSALTFVCMYGGVVGWGWTDRFLLTLQSHTAEKAGCCAACSCVCVCVCLCRIIFLLSWPLQKRYWTCPLKPVKQAYKTLQWPGFSFLSASQTLCQAHSIHGKVFKFLTSFFNDSSTVFAVSSTGKILWKTNQWRKVLFQQSPQKTSLQLFLSMRLNEMRWDRKKRRDQLRLDEKYVVWHKIKMRWS